MTGRNVERAGLSPLADGAADADPVPSAVPAFKALYRQYFDFCWSCARSLGVEPAAMDDLVQEVFIVIHARLHTLENPSALRSWIYGVVRRTVSTHRRAQRARAEAQPGAAWEGDAVSQAPTPLEQTEKNAELELLARLLDELDEPKREVFALVEVEELSVPEAAALLEIPLNTAYSRLRAARATFEAALARHEARNKGA
jgi:RNA polymerase sigma-70 factor (ECF subfamily)